LYLESKTDEAQADFCNYLKTAVSLQKAFELLRQAHLSPDVLLQAFDPVQPQHHPQLYGPKPAAKWNLPVLHSLLNQTRNGDVLEELDVDPVREKSVQCKQFMSAGRKASHKKTWTTVKETTKVKVKVKLSLCFN
jgi:hypothetical protein